MVWPYIILRRVLIMRDILKNIIREESLDYLLKNYPTTRLLLNASESELTKAPGVGSKKAKELKSIFELSMLLLEPEASEPIYIRNPLDVYNLLKIMTFYEEERCVAILLDTKNKVISQTLVSQGSLNSSILHPREVFAPAVRQKAESIILCHNHPSGDPTPSQEDISISKRLVESGKILGIDLVDSVIIGSGSYISLKERGEL